MDQLVLERTEEALDDELPIAVEAAIVRSALGARGYLTKPIEVDQFCALLDELMAKK